MVNVAKSNNKKQSLRKKKLKRYLQILINILREKNEQVILNRRKFQHRRLLLLEKVNHSCIMKNVMKNVNLNLKPVRGKKLLLKVKTTINYDDLKKSNRKAFTPRPVFLWFRRICITLYR